MTLGVILSKLKVQRREPTRRAIRDAAVRLLSVHGPQALTMERVAREAGLAKGTLYLYFNDKKALLESMKEEALRPLREEMAELLNGSLPPREKLVKLVMRHVGYFDEHRDFLKVLLWQRQIVESFAKRRQSDPYRSFVEQVASVINDGINSKAFRDVDAAKAAVMFVEADIALASQRLLASSSCDPERDARLLLDIFFNGVSARKT